MAKLLHTRQGNTPHEMKYSSLTMSAMTALMLMACGAKSYTPDNADANTETATAEEGFVNTASTDEVPTKEFTVTHNSVSKTYLVADVDDAAAIYKPDIDTKNALIVVSKREYRLYVYDTTADTTLAASFPICYAKNPGQKEKQGDNSTPECTIDHPFSVSEIKDASTWSHDFGDGRGELPSYGQWFCRLDLSEAFPDNEAVAKNRSIGIHGSTSNEPSVPGRDSEGCIRLRDADLVTLHDHYIAVGMKVVVKPITQSKLPFELQAERTLGDKYKAAKIGNPLFK